VGEALKDTGYRDILGSPGTHSGYDRDALEARVGLQAVAVGAEEIVFDHLLDPDRATLVVGQMRVGLDQGLVGVQRSDDGIGWDEGRQRHLCDNRHEGHGSAYVQGGARDP